MEIDKVFTSDVDGVADNLFSAVKNSVSEIKAMQQRKAAENVQLVIQALKKIESDLQDKFDGVTTVIDMRVASIKDGRDGTNGRDGRDGKEGRPGKDGLPGRPGKDGMPGADGRDGEDGVSVTDARIDFDGSLIIGLSSGREINVGEVVAPDLAERIKVITNGGGTSQGVLDTLASLQAQITAISNLGAVNYQGTWNASTNTPTITGGSGTKGYYYVVSVAGSTSIDGQTLWGVGDWIIFNGTAWQKVDGGSTGDFTNITASGSLTLSGGTANGVAYLNGSKVLTTGSALTFDGNNLSIGANGQVGSRLTVIANGAMATFNTGAAADGRIEYAYNGTNIFYTGVNSASLMMLMARSGVELGFGANNIEQMRLTSTGLGIGTSSPGAKLEVNGSFITTADASGLTTLGRFSSGYAWSLIRPSSTATGIEFRTNAGDALYQLDQSSGANKHIWYTGASEQMRLTSTGLGIGTSSPAEKLDVNGNMRVTGASNQRSIGFNFYGTSQYNFYVDGSSDAARMDIRRGTTQVATFDSSGNLGLGVTPSAWSGVNGVYEIKGNAYIYSTTGVLSAGANAYFNGTNWIYKTTQAATRYEQVNGVHKWDIAPSGTAGNAITFTQAMALDASGNLLVGTTSNTSSYRMRVLATGTAGAIFQGSEYVQVVVTDGTRSMYQQIYNNAAVFGTATSTPLVFNIADTERARIDTSGNLLVGTTTTPTTNVKGVALQSFSDQGRLAIGATVSTADLAYFYSSTALAGAITVSGSTCSYTSFSDYRLKDSVAPLTGALAKVAALKPVTYKWKADGSDGEGFIAHELAEVVPQCVTGQKDAVDADGNPKYQGIDTSFLVATLTAAIQELKADLDATKAELAQLKGA